MAIIHENILKSNFKYMLLSANPTEIAKPEVWIYTHLKKNGYTQQQVNAKLTFVLRRKFVSVYFKRQL